jgi:hypothetical protein
MSAPSSVLDYGPQNRESWLGNSAEGVDTLDNCDCALEIQRVLKHDRWTMAELSAQTKFRFGKGSDYFIPTTFLCKQRAGITPHICQIAAFSEITGYRFSDWMYICGFDLGLILQLQLRIPNVRTIMVVPGLGPGETASFFEETSSPRIGSHNRYCYAKIGSRDAVLYPVVRPGSVVRADRRYCRSLLNAPSSADHLWLVEHPTGITCCHLKSLATGEIVLFPHLAPLSPWPLRLSTQVRILGLVDSQMPPYQQTDFEPLHKVTEADRSAVSISPTCKMTLSQLIRISRLRTGLTFREAHKTTTLIACLLQNRAFRISLGLLSDYEAVNKVPRHIEKIIALCVVYGIDPCELLTAAGITLRDSAKRRLFTREQSVRCEAQTPVRELRTLRSKSHGIVIRKMPRFMGTQA